MAALLLIGGYAALVGLGRLLARSVLYPAPRHGLTRPPAGAELRSYRAADGVPVQALVYPAPGSSSRSIVFFHGNGETVADSVFVAAELVERGLGFVAVEYRGYGESRQGKPTEQGLYVDAEAVLAALASEGTGPDRVVLWGSSLGSGVAVEMAVRGHGCRLVLSSPFTSIPTVARRHFPFLPMRLIVEDEYDSLSKAGRLKLPTLVIHGDHDRVVPYDLGVTLSRAIAGSELVTVPGAGHNDLFLHDGRRLLDRIAAHAKG
ncbi:MAG: alpha/beta fold hydrolase [Deltaproteobacteria bacterium]|nr:alpha/beta fold hydrolase [Deltaproteobacteria bacterium]